MPEAPVFDLLGLFWSTEVLDNKDSMSVSAPGVSTATADSWEVILRLGALLGLKKLATLIEFELWRRGRKRSLWGLRRGEPVRKVELRWRRWSLVVNSMFGGVRKSGKLGGKVRSLKWEMGGE